ncbi:chitin synthase Chs2 [Schizosaccharomyces japonicus yFS275]|uniref:Chitin synthase n=1 Tax=Schizosaccharomyces japonicus (strain yFS275 / FY16936) TaxID=402676 RepID=B6JVM7_SCHJY|nr:chitin synthase Chs2 [Schizosaccharomyces japonicus yFS275]EEB05428.1 chitin synthase Chs2 [Schizosaccharomyces japonicus yFS275]
MSRQPLEHTRRYGSRESGSSCQLTVSGSTEDGSSTEVSNPTDYTEYDVSSSVPDCDLSKVEDYGDDRRFSMYSMRSNLRSSRPVSAAPSYRPFEYDLNGNIIESNFEEPIYEKGDWTEAPSYISNYEVERELPKLPVITETNTLRRDVPQYSVKEVPLVDGNLIVDYSVSKQLLALQGTFADQPEAQTLRYSAVTCEPEETQDKGYKLRQQIYGRETEIAVCLTLEKESVHQFINTLQCVMENIADLCSRESSRFWNTDSWQKVVVCIIADGDGDLDCSFVDVLSSLGVYQHRSGSKMVSGSPVLAHIYEYTSCLRIDQQFYITSMESVPINLIYCKKAQSCGKVNSHRWFLNGIAKLLQPKVCFFIKAGTAINETAIYHIWKQFTTDNKVGGVCGNTNIELPNWYSTLCNPLLAVRNFELQTYKCMQYPFDSCMGYVIDIPGKFYAYRYAVLVEDAFCSEPLKDYFQKDISGSNSRKIFGTNACLAEESLLSWSVMLRPKTDWVMKYVDTVKATIRSQNSIASYLDNAKYEVNTSLGSTLYALSRFPSIWETNHSTLRQFSLSFKVLLNSLELQVNYFAMANLFSVFYFVCHATSTSDYDLFGHGWGNHIFVFFYYVFICLIFSQFVLALGNRPYATHSLYLGSMCISVIVCIYFLICLFYVACKNASNSSSNGDSILGNNSFTTLLFCPLMMFLFHLITALLQLNPWHILTGSIPYVLLLPFRVFTKNIFAFCHMHDTLQLGERKHYVDIEDGLLECVRSNNSQTIVLSIPTEEDVENQYHASRNNLHGDASDMTMNHIVSESQQSRMFADYTRSIRTRFVLLWALCNLVLAMILTQSLNDTSIDDNGYVKFIFWLLFSFSALKMMGAFSYATIQLFQKLRTKVYSPKHET